MIKSITVMGYVGQEPHLFTARKGQRGKFKDKYIVFPIGKGNDTSVAIDVNTLEEVMSYKDKGYLVRVSSGSINASRVIAKCKVNY